MPVMMVFTNLFRIELVALKGDLIRLTWPTVPNWQYYVEASADLTTWQCTSSNMMAASTSLTWTVSPSAPYQSYRVRQSD